MNQPEAACRVLTPKRTGKPWTCRSCELSFKNCSTLPKVESKRVAIPSRTSSGAPVTRCRACSAAVPVVLECRPTVRNKSERIRIRCSAATESGMCRDAKTSPHNRKRGSCRIGSGDAASRRDCGICADLFRRAETLVSQSECETDASRKKARETQSRDRPSGRR